MFATGETVRLAEWIIDDTCLVNFIFSAMYDSGIGPAASGLWGLGEPVAATPNDCGSLITGTAFDAGNWSNDDCSATYTYACQSGMYCK